MQSCATCEYARKKPLAPTVVAPRPLSVPTFIVTDSRMSQFSPMVSVVRPPLCLESCGGPPSAANACARVFAPTVVAPVTETWPARCTLSPSTTSAPTWQKGPTWTPEPSCAPGSTKAVWWMKVSLVMILGGSVCRLRRHHCRYLGLGHFRTFDDCLTCETPDVAALLELFHMYFQTISGHHGAAELGIVDGHEIDQRRLVLAGRANADRTSRLRHGLDDKHSRHHRLLWKMPLEMRFVRRDVLDADRGIVAVDFNDAVDEQKRIAVRQQPHQAEHVETVERIGGGGVI